MSKNAYRILLSFVTSQDAYNLKGLAISIRLDREKFDQFPVFDKVKFTIKGQKQLPLVEFKISANESVYYYHSSDDKITTAEIVYLKANPQQPLVYGITSGGKTTYYRQTNVTHNGHYKALTKHHFGDLAEALIEDNDNINGTVTFRVDKKQKYNNIGLVDSRDLGSRYTEYTHKPKTRGGFNRRKALVVNNVDGINSKIKFAGSSKIKIQDTKLDSISVYFFDFGIQKHTPLMIKVPVGSKQHYYTPATGHDEVWVEVDVDKDLKGGNDNRAIIEYLDKIKKWLFETVYVLIHKQEPYRMLTADDPKNSKGDNTVSETQPKPGHTVQGSVGDDQSTQSKPQSGNRGRKSRTRTSDLNPKNTITVTKQTCRTELGNYVCFQHDLKVHKDPTPQGNEQDQSGSGTAKNITVYISNVPINIHMLIKGGLAGYMGVRGDTKVEKADFLLLQHTLKLNVFFYNSPEGETEERMDVDQGPTSGQTTNPKLKPDHIPLMFNYYNHWFKPRSINKYFYVWDRVDDLTVSDHNSCKKEEAAKIKNHLDEVNRMLNRVKLNFNINNNSSTTGTATGTPSVTAHVVVNPGITGINTEGNRHNQSGEGLVPSQVIGNTPASLNQYGIPYPTYLNKSYGVNRISVTFTQFSDDPWFISYTHKSINGFGIGTTFYRTKERDKGKGRGASGQPASSVIRFTSEQIKSLEAQSSYKYYTNLNSKLINGVEDDLDGKVEVPAKAVTVYFFNEDAYLNYPLLAEYLRPHNEHKYYVLKHCETAIS